MTDAKPIRTDRNGNPPLYGTHFIDPRVLEGDCVEVPEPIRVPDAAMKQRVAAHRREIAVRPRHVWRGTGFARCEHCGIGWSWAESGGWCPADTP
jgi:hypothetical protein